MSRASRLKNILNTTVELWNDSSDTDQSSTCEDDQTKTKPPMKISLSSSSSSSSDTSSDENSETSIQPTCCLICSVLPNLSDINTCSKHLSLLTRPQIVYMMQHPTTHCHCRSKRRCRQSSSSSSTSTRYRNKRSLTIQSSDPSTPEDAFFSPTVQSQQASHDDPFSSPLSPSLPPSSTISTSLRQCNELVFFPRSDQRTNLQPCKYNPEDSSQTSPERPFPDVVEIDSGECMLLSSSKSGSIVSNRIVHVKDEDEIVNDEPQQNEQSISMAQATQQMLENEYPQPIIYLERVRFELDY